MTKGDKEVEKNADFSDPNHFLYLHHSDHPNYVLSTQLLNENNYHQWRRYVEVSLEVKNKIQFINGTYKVPEGDSTLDMQSRRCNSMVISWLLHSVEKDISETLLYCNTASEIWSDLQLRFGQPSLTRTFQVQKELFTISQGNLSISSYYTKFKCLWEEYLVLVEMPKCVSCKSVNPIPQLVLNQQILQFLVGLNESYNSRRGNILMMSPIPKIGEVFQMALQEEKQRSLQNNNSRSLVALSVFPRPGNYTESGSNQNQGQYSSKPKMNSKNDNQTFNNAGNSEQKPKPYYFREHCKIPGHSISRCFKVHGYPKDFKEKRFPANVSSIENDRENDEKSQMFTKSQNERLLALLDCQQNSATGSNTNQACMLAGPFNEQSSSTW